MGDDALPPLADIIAMRPRSTVGGQLVQRLRTLCGQNVADVNGWTVGAIPLDSPSPDLQTGLVFAEGVRRAPLGATRLSEILAAHDITAFEFQADGTASAIRSPGGRIPLYAGVDADRAIVATRLDLIARLTSAPKVDRLALAMFTAQIAMSPDRRSIIAGVSALGRGERVDVAEHTVTVTRWWRPELVIPPAPTKASQKAHQKALREGLLRFLDEELPQSGTLVALSGGADSGALAYLAGRHLGRGLMTYSFLPMQPEARAYELSFIEPIWRDLHIAERRTVELSDYRRAEMTRDHPPSWLPIQHPVLHDLMARPGLQPRVLLGGEGADLLVGSRTATLPDWARLAGPRQLAQPWHWPRPRAAIRALVRRVLRRSRISASPAMLPAGYSTEVQAEYAAWRASLTAPEAVPRPQLHHLMQQDLWLAMNWEACAPLGVRRATPFHTRELLELAYACHPAELVNRRDKRLSANALRGLVPETTLNRQGKDQFPPVPETREPDRWRHQIARSQKHGLLDPIHSNEDEHLRIASAIDQTLRASESAATVPGATTQMDH